MTGCDEIVDDNNVLSSRNSSLLHLERILSHHINLCIIPIERGDVRLRIP